MRISERGQIAIPKGLRERFGLNHNVEWNSLPPREDSSSQRRTAAQHPVERVYAILGRGEDTDAYIGEVRGR